MKVKTLIGLLERFNPNDDVIIATGEIDGSPLTALDEERYWPETKKNGQIGLRCLTDSDIEHGLTYDDVMENGIDCVVLWSEDAL